MKEKEDKDKEDKDKLKSLGLDLDKQVKTLPRHFHKEVRKTKLNGAKISLYATTAKEKYHYFTASYKTEEGKNAVPRNLIRKLTKEQKEDKKLIKQLKKLYQLPENPCKELEEEIEELKAKLENANKRIVELERLLPEE